MASSNILSAPIDGKFLITYAKQDFIKISQKAKKKCKIMKFPAEWNLSELLTKIPILNPGLYSNLFIFIIEENNFQFSDCETNKVPEKFKVLQNALLMFAENRPLILQLESLDENEIRTYYKEETSHELFIVNQNVGENIQNFSTFLSYLFIKKFEDFEEDLIEKIFNVEQSSIILKFLKTLKFSENILLKIILKCAARGSKSDLIAVLDGPLCESKQNSQLGSQNYITEKLLDSSILYEALKHSNAQILDFLIQDCAHLIQQLEYEHQLEISTTAYDINNLKVLCDLVEFVDFPFPEKADLTHERLRIIISNRMKFHNAVINEDFREISDFIVHNSNIKIAYDSNNMSVLCHAFTSKKYKVFFHLKSLGFRAAEFDSHEKFVTDDEEKSRIKKFAREQRKQNINNSVPNKMTSIMLLSTRSFIFNKKITKKMEAKYRNKIEKWYRDIYKVKFCSMLIDVAAKCDKLKIIFDFDCDSIEKIDVTKTASSLGITYPSLNWILIGARAVDEQKVKGVIIHEICHYVMRLVYENSENPYFKSDVKSANKFNEIVAAIDVWSEEGLKKEIDDECDAIISSVYQLYSKEDFHPELIVRVPQILVQYDNDAKKSVHLEEKFKPLFEFFEMLVLPELENFNLEERKNVRKFNEMLGLLTEIQELKYELNDLKDFNLNQRIVLKTNIPKLLFLNIYKVLFKSDGPLLDSKNIFITPKILNNSNIFRKFEQIVKQNPKINIFVDCSKEFREDLRRLIINKSSMFIFIVSDKNQSENVAKVLKSDNLQATEINFNWVDLKKDSQKNLLQTKVIFQNSTKLSINDLIFKDLEQDEELGNIIDEQLLNLLIEGTKVHINSSPNEGAADKEFDFLFMKRKLVKSYKIRKTLKLFECACMMEIDNENLAEKLETPRLQRKADKTTNDEMNENPKDNTCDNVDISHFEEVCEKLSLSEMLEDVANKKYVLISDVAGTGKTWILKNFIKLIRKKYQRTWVTYVDLKLFIKEFKSQVTEFDFVTFMTEKILQPRSKFEANIFKKLYKKGKVCILFDGFDEIAPDCTEQAIKAFKKFDFNEGNQLWIATRDYFEADLKKELQTDTVYKLDVFTEQEGVDLIASIWMLSEKHHDCHKFKEFKESAQKLCKRILVSKSNNSMTNTIGFPQLYKTTAEVFKEHKSTKLDLTNLKVYIEFIKLHYERWSDRKGELRKCDSICSLHKGLNVREVHQLFALKILFPDMSRFCDLELEYCDWSEAEIIACGLLSKKGENFFFPHETFREFFAADFIIRILLKSGFDEEDFCKIFIKFITFRNFSIIRMFLNEALTETVVMEKCEKKIPKICKTFYGNVDSLKDLSNVFKENLEHLVDFIIQIFRNGRYEDVWRVLNVNNLVISTTIHANLFCKFQNFFINFLNSEDLQNFLMENKLITVIANSSIDAKTLKDFVDMVQFRINQQFIRKLLQSRDENGDNVFLCLIRSDHTNEDKFKAILQLMTNFFTASELNNLLMQSNNIGWNIFHICADTKNKEKLKFLWKELGSNSEQFKRLFYQKTTGQYYNVLHFVAFCDKIEFHETFWELSMKTFVNRQELTNLILQPDKNAENFISLLVGYMKQNIIEFTFKMFVNNFSKCQFQEILNSKGRRERNLLQTAVRSSEDIETHKFLWKMFRNSYETNEELLKIVEKADKEQNNILHLAAYFTTSEIFEFLMEELEKIASIEMIKRILSALGSSDRNILQKAARRNKSYKLHESLWKAIHKYFGIAEIVKMVKHTDGIGYDLCTNTIALDSKEVIELIWNGICESLNFDNDIAIQLGVMNEFYIYLMNFITHLFHPKAKEILKLKWKEAVNKINLDDAYQILKVIGTEEKSKFILHAMAVYERIEFHKALWNNLLHIYKKNKEELKELMTQENKNKNNYIHLLMLNNNPDIIELTLRILKETFNEIQYKEILFSKGRWERNLLQNLANESENIKSHQILWKALKDLCKSDEEFIKILSTIDENGSNTFHLAASATTSEILEFMINESEKVSSREEMKKLCTTSGCWNENLLQIAACFNDCPKTHEKLWQIIQEYFNYSEIIEFIYYCDKDGDNILHNAVYWNTTEIVELTWKQIKLFVYKKPDQKDYLNKKGHIGHNLQKLSSTNRIKDSKVPELVEKIMHEYEIEL